MKPVSATLSLALMLVLAHGTCHRAGAHAAGYRIITDMDDRKIEVPVNPKRIVCMHGVSSERIMILGKGSSMTLMATTPSPWAYRLFPEMKQVRTVALPVTPNLEDMVKEKVDLLLYSPIPVETRKCRAISQRPRVDVRAVRQGRVHSMAPYSASGRPDWILGLLHMATIIYPEQFSFDMEKIADAFYTKFLGISFAPEGRRRSIAHPGVLDGAKAFGTVRRDERSLIMS